MVLRPLDLGRLSIELTSNQQGLTTHIMAQNEDVRAYIEKNIDSLRQQLSEAGVNVNSIQIKSAGSEGSTTYEGNQNFNRENQEKVEEYVDLCLKAIRDGEKDSTLKVFDICVMLFVKMFTTRSEYELNAHDLLSEAYIKLIENIGVEAQYVNDLNKE
jgi:hypothetical protein